MPPLTWEQALSTIILGAQVLGLIGWVAWRGVQMVRDIRSLKKLRRRVRRLEDKLNVGRNEEDELEDDEDG